MDKKFLILQTHCWKCKKEFKICMIRDENNYTIRPDDFTQEDILFAKKNGIKIEERNSDMIGKVNVCICPHCNAFYGNHYLLDDFMEAEFEKDAITEIDY